LTILARAILKQDGSHGSRWDLPLSRHRTVGASLSKVVFLSKHGIRCSNNFGSSHFGSSHFGAGRRSWKSMGFAFIPPPHCGGFTVKSCQRRSWDALSKLVKIPTQI
jgi:hypothetical protein